MTIGDINRIGLKAELGSVYANNPADFGDISSAATTSFFADTSYFRDSFIESKISERDDEMAKAGLGSVKDALVSQAESETPRQFSDAVSALPFIPAYEQRVADKRRELIDSTIKQARLSDASSPLAQLRTTDEIRELAVLTRQGANQELESAQTRAESGFDAVAGTFAGGALGVMLDPINAITLPLGASASTGIMRAMATEGAINSGIELFQTPENMAWAKESGVEFGLGQAASNIALAGVGGAAITGITRGLGKLLTKGKTSEIMEKIAADEKMPSELRDAAEYQARVAHIDDDSPLASVGSATDEMVAKHRNNLQETQDALVQGREPEIDTTVFGDVDTQLKAKIDTLEAEVAQLQKDAEQPIVDFEQSPQQFATLPKRLSKSAITPEIQSRQAQIAQARQMLEARTEAKDPYIAQAKDLKKYYADKDRARAYAEKKAAEKPADLLGQKATRKAPDFQPKPILQFLEGRGGIKAGSAAADELEQLGVKRKGLVSAKGKITSLDNIPKSEFDDWASRYDQSSQEEGETSYVSLDYLRDKLDAEQRGDYFMTQKERDAVAGRENMDALRDELYTAHDIEIDSATPKQIADALRVIGSEEGAIARAGMDELRGMAARYKAEGNMDMFELAESRLVDMGDVGAKTEDEIARINDPAGYIKERVDRLTDPQTNAAMLADFDRAARDMPDYTVMFADGSTKSIKELAAILREDDDVIAAVMTCGVGK